jgi:hypothetical protein
VVGGDSAVRLQPQHRQNRARLGAAERKRLPVGAGLDGAENVEFHEATIFRVLSHDSLSYRPAAQRPPDMRRTLRQTGLRPVYELRR